MDERQNAPPWQPEVVVSILYLIIIYIHKLLEDDWLKDSTLK